MHHFREGGSRPWPSDGFRPRTLIDTTAGDRLGALWATAIAAGLRQGELLALRWSDVDLEAATLSVRYTLRRGTRELAEPKTDRARRTLRLGGEAVTALRDHRRRQLEERLAAARRWHDDGYVFASGTGTALDARNVIRALAVALERAGLPSQRFHDLRHCYATLLLEHGEELAVVSRTLGHADLSTTADIYAHLTPAMLERTARRKDEILGARRASG